MLKWFTYVVCPVHDTRVLLQLDYPTSNLHPLNSPRSSINNKSAEMIISLSQAEAHSVSEQRSRCSAPHAMNDVGGQICKLDSDRGFKNSFSSSRLDGVRPASPHVPSRPVR